MAIDEHATGDLSLSEEDAEMVVGGRKKSSKRHTTHKAAPTYPVEFIKAAGATGSIPAAPDPSMDPDDCGPES
jgi:hypothetical protein